MNEPHDDLDRWLRPPVEPMDTPPGAFAAVRRRARRRRLGQAAATTTIALMFCVGSVAGAVVATGNEGPGEVPPPVTMSKSATSRPATTSSPKTSTSVGASPHTSQSPDSEKSPRADSTNETPETSTNDETAEEAASDASSDASSDAPEESPGATNESTGHPTTGVDEPELTRCHTGELAARITVEGAAAGTVYATLIFTNESDSACTLNGHPGMLLLDADGEPLPTEVRRVAPEPRRVVLDAGGTASATLHWGTVPTGDQPCQEPSESALVTPPDAYEQLTLSFESSSCHGEIFMTSVVAGNDGAR